MWLVTVPNGKQSPDTTYTNIQNSVAVNDICKTFRFEMPSLVVGTLDTLMALSDDLGKISNQVEVVSKKIERQYVEIAGAKADQLRVNETTVESFIKRFQWDFARFQHQGRQLTELVEQIQSMSNKIDEELKILVGSFTEKNLGLAAIRRRQQINLSTSDFEDFLTPEAVAKLDLINTDNLLSIIVVVPKVLEADFRNKYSTIGSNIASFGGPDWTNSASIGQNDGKFGANVKRSAVKGSPVVPNSLRKVAEEGDLVMFSVTVLRGHYQAGQYVDNEFVPGEVFRVVCVDAAEGWLLGAAVDYVEPLKVAFRESRFTVRDFSYDSSKSGGVEAEIERAQLEMKQVRATTLRWCKAHFGEVYNAFVHLKVIQGFVESVLRYGLPVNFVSFFLEPNPKREKELMALLTSTVVQLRPELRMKKLLQDEEEAEEDTTHLPYVCQKFALIGNAASTGGV